MTQQFISLGEIITRLATDDEFVAWGLVELHKRQTEDERATRETRHLNLFGFSKKHVSRGEFYVSRILSGKPLSRLERDGARDLAMHYRKQIFLFVLGAVPENHLNMGV